MNETLHAPYQRDSRATRIITADLARHSTALRRLFGAGDLARLGKVRCINEKRRPSCKNKNQAVTESIPEEWAQLSAPWRIAFELAWEGLLAGSPPVGAVVVNPAGQVIARGRSRRHESTAPVGELAGSRLAHAEVNALAALPVESNHELWLYVTLEPCLLCTAAAAISHIRGVWFAGSDPMWRFLEELGTFHAELRRREFRRRGPMPGPIGAWATLLPLVERLRRNPTGTRIEAFEPVGGELVEYATELVASGRADDLVAMPLEVAVRSLWPDLLELANAVP